MHDRGDTPVKATTTSVEILEALLELGSASLTEVTNAVALSKSSVHNHLKTLEHLGLVVRDDAAYRASLRFLEIGAAVRDRAPLYRFGRREVDRLARASGLAAGLVAFERDRAVCLYTETGQRIDQAPIQTGDVVPLHASAPGKAILATLPDDELDRVLPRLDLEATTDGTTTDEAALRTELETVRTRGLASDREEWQSNVRALAAGIARTDELTAGSIFVLSDAESMSGKQFQQDVPGLLISSANQLRQEL
jgi:DNA-binding IclR family transcriptional regulator